MYAVQLDLRLANRVAFVNCRMGREATAIVGELFLGCPSLDEEPSGYE